MKGCSHLRTKRAVFLSIAITALMVGVGLAVFVWSHDGSISTQDATITAVNADGRIEWDQVRFVPAETDNTIAEPIPNSHHAGRLSDKAKFFVAIGDNDIALDANGAGTSPVSADQFRARWSTLYAVRLTIADGVVQKIAEYYHP